MKNFFTLKIIREIYASKAACVLPMKGSGNHFLEKSEGIDPAYPDLRFSREEGHFEVRKHSRFSSRPVRPFFRGFIESDQGRCRIVGKFEYGLSAKIAPVLFCLIVFFVVLGGAGWLASMVSCYVALLVLQSPLYLSRWLALFTEEEIIEYLNDRDRADG